MLAVHLARRRGGWLASMQACRLSCCHAGFHGEISPKQRLGETSDHKVNGRYDSGAGMPAALSQRTDRGNLPYKAVAVGFSQRPGPDAIGRADRRTTAQSAGKVLSPRVLFGCSTGAWAVTGDAPPGADYASARYGRSRNTGHTRCAHKENSGPAPAVQQTRRTEYRCQCSEGR